MTERNKCRLKGTEKRRTIMPKRGGEKYETGSEQNWKGTLLGQKALGRRNLKRTAGRPSEKGIQRDSMLWDRKFEVPAGPVRNGFGKACRHLKKFVLGRELLSGGGCSASKNKA